MFFRVLIFNFFVKLSGSYWKLFFSRESAILKTKISKTYNIQNYKKSPPARTRRSVGSQQFETRRAWLGRSGRTAGRTRPAGSGRAAGRRRPSTSRLGSGRAAGGTQHRKQVGSGRAAGASGRTRLERRRQLGWLAGLGGRLAAGPLGGGLARGRRLAAGPPASALRRGEPCAKFKVGCAQPRRIRSGCPSWLAMAPTPVLQANPPKCLQRSRGRTANSGECPGGKRPSKL